MTPYLAPGCPEELLRTKNMLGGVKRKGQAGRGANPSRDSPPVSAGTPAAARVPGRTAARPPAPADHRPPRLGVTRPGSGAGGGDPCQLPGSLVGGSAELEVTRASSCTGLDRLQLNRSRQTFVQSIFKILPLPL